ncbi:MAG: CoA-acylating methylmalonate-semialdehyde dehydrogenase [Gammaproteobacteria bacterium]|nr:CoA-acylating methylmalonate-semialdehyde dehydrogenase [Gammaproteobacteria bacterium]
MKSIEAVVNDIRPEILGHFINGTEVAGPERYSEVFNPATGAVSKHLSLAGPDELEQAIDAAKASGPVWRQTPPQKRAQVLFRYRELLVRHAAEICQLITAEHGKVITDAHGELSRGIEIVDYACGISELLKGEHSKNAGSAIDSWSEFQPLGLVAGITPFNFPAMVPLWMFPLAIACGNTFLLKPSERDPGAPLLLARLFQEAGLPDGVLSVINGDREIVNLMLQDKRIAAVSFVGSTLIAESVYRRASASGKRVQALGGAKNHAVIMPDADVGSTVSALIGAAYGSSGERCMAISVVVCVGEDTAERTVASLRERLAELKIGPGNDAENDMGPLISDQALARVKSYIGEGVAAGATLVVDGRQVSVPGFDRGFFLGPSLFDHVTSEMSIYRDEIFGPVLCVVRVETLEMAMTLVNQHEYGNGSCIFTRDGETARLFTDNVLAGMVGVNIALPVPVANQSFGGCKRSLFGDLYVYGPDAIRFYTRRKTITQRWPSSSTAEQTSFSFPSG